MKSEVQEDILTRLYLQMPIRLIAMNISIQPTNKMILRKRAEWEFAI